jgi:hypothetical protein
MPDPTSKSELLETMLAARGRLDSLIDRIPRSIMTRPGAPGTWSAKDILAHLASYDRWLGLTLALRGQKPPDFWIEDIPLDEFNRRLFEENCDKPLDEVLQESREVWREMLQAMQTRTEAYLFAEQSIPGVPYHFRPCDLLKNESYGHYYDHFLALDAWLRASP